MKDFILLCTKIAAKFAKTELFSKEELQVVLEQKWRRESSGSRGLLDYIKKALDLETVKDVKAGNS